MSSDLAMPSRRVLATVAIGLFAVVGWMPVADRSTPPDVVDPWHAVLVTAEGRQSANADDDAEAAPVGADPAPAEPAAPPAAEPAPEVHLAVATQPEFQYTRESSPNRTIVEDDEGEWVATFTDGTRTVTVAGPTRTLSEPGVSAVVESTTWVRVLPQPFNGTVDTAWLEHARNDRSPDILVQSLQYVQGAPTINDSTGLRIGGQSAYSHLGRDGRRSIGSDFVDYLGVSKPGAGGLQPRRERAGSMDCSGYMRMLWGYRNGIPMTRAPNGTGLPRTSYQQYESAPGVITIPNTGKQAPAEGLSPGDLVFFDATSRGGSRIDHVGMYLGIDNDGRRRFISSRKTPNGPTMGDVAAHSVLDGSGFYAKAFRGARRL